MDVETQKAVARFELITSATETWEQNMERPGVTADLRTVLAALAKLQAERDGALQSALSWQAAAITATGERDEAREVLRPFKAAFEYGVTELPDDIQAIQLMRSRVGFNHFRAASRALGGGE